MINKKYVYFFSSRRRHTICYRDWSSDVCSSDLPTIRSRLVPVRVGGVGDEAVPRFLQTELDPAPRGAALEQRVLLAQGSIGRALAAGAEGDTAEKAAERLLAAVRGGPARWAAAPLGQAPLAHRGDFTAGLDALAL